MKRRQASRKDGSTCAFSMAARSGFRASCFHSAMLLSTSVIKAAPCTTCTRVLGEKSASTRPKKVPLPTMPISSITYIRATTRGRVSSSARSVASARPAVCAVCRPIPTTRKANAAAV